MGIVASLALAMAVAALAVSFMAALKSFRLSRRYRLLCEARAIRSELRLTEMDEWRAIQDARIATGELTLDNMFDPALKREMSDRLRAVEAEAVRRMGPKRAAILAREEARMREYGPYQSGPEHRREMENRRLNYAGGRGHWPDGSLDVMEQDRV